MITAAAFAGKRYAVFGLARSGLATVAALTASGAHVIAWDDKPEARAKISDFVRPELVEGRGSQGGATRPSTSSGRTGSLEFADLNTVPLEGFDALVVSPGVPLNTHPLVRRAAAAGVEVIGDIELFARARPELPPHKVIGITGTNGKSTTTALIHHIVQTAGIPARLGGNIGLPILGQDPLPEGGVYVLELSSFQLDLTKSLACDVAILTNITPDHLDRYDGFESYAASKERLFGMQNPRGFAVLGGSDEATLRIAQDLARSPRVYVPVPDSFSGQDEWPALQGPHNLQNVALACTATALLGVQGTTSEEALRAYPGLPHRMERIATKKGVLYVNDSKATNPTSTAPALGAYPVIHWICGGRNKTAELDACLPYLGHVKAAYTVGEASELFANILRPHVPVEQIQTVAEATRLAASRALPGEVILLSPACASYDQFSDFEARGEAFRKVVGELPS